MALVTSPESFIPPSEMTGIFFFAATFTHSATAEICGTPTPLTTRVVQIEPGPIPTFTASTPALISAAVPSAVATLPPMTCNFGKDFLILRMVLSTFSEWPCALSITSTSSPTRTKSSICCSGFWVTPSAAPTNNRPLESLAALGNRPAFSMSFMVINPLRFPFLSTTNNFSIRLSCRIFFDFKRGVPSGIVTRSSQVIRDFIFLLRLVSNLKSRFVKMPTSFFFWVIGIPVILYFFIT